MSFKEDAKTLLLQSGNLIYDEDKSYFWGWHDYVNDIGMRYGKNPHEAGCHWVATDATRLVEKTFYEFDGTENDSQRSTLLVLTDVDCFCGFIKGRRIGRQGTTGELLQELLGLEVDYE